MDVEKDASAFKKMLEAYSARMGEIGVKIRAYDSERLEDFVKLDAAARKGAIDAVSMNLEIFSEMDLERESHGDTLRLLWRVLRRLGFVPEADIFDKITDEDVVEVYSSDQRHLFWNHRLAQLVSFSAEQLFTGHWGELTRREDRYTQQLTEAAIAMLTGKIRHTVDPQVEEHDLWEVGTRELRRFRMKLRYFSPLSCDGKIAGVIVVHRCRILPPAA